MVDRKSEMGLSMVMLERAELPSSEVVLAKLQEILADQFDIRIADNSNPKYKFLSFNVGDSILALGPLPTPIPHTELASLIQAGWHWPEAKDVIPRHTAHILVTLANAPSDPIDRALLLTRVTAAVVSVTPSIGVYWGSGPAISPKDMFVEEGAKVSREYFFPPLWIGFNVLSEGEGRAIVTQGMRQFNLDELEVWATTANVREALPLSLQVTEYVLEKGPVLKAGQTFGRSATEKFPISHHPWRFDNSKNAVILDMRPPEKRMFIGKLFGK